MAVTYPAPSRTMSLDECKRKMGGDAKIYIKSRFAVCTGLRITTLWQRQSGAIGTSTFTVYVRGTVPKEADRTMHFDYDVVDFTQVGTTGVAAGYKIRIKPQIPQDWPAAARPTQSGNLPVTKTWQELRLMSPAHFNNKVRYAPGQGTGAGAADVVFAVYQPEITTTLPPGWVGESPKTGKPFMMAPRWDAAKYLNNSTGGGSAANKGSAAFSYLATLNYSSKQGAVERGVALHIKKAYASPGATKPPNALKKIPGQNAKTPLHRLYLDERRRKDNRARAVTNCRRHFGPSYTDGGKQCDEFPFATTYEGCAQAEYDPHVEKNNFSVLPVNSAENRDAGILLSQFYTKNRLLDGMDDGFIVKIS
ncbi:NucA/NucB deoxyribonuclease domain-containing protein [Streptomyces sp. NPDC055287]